MGIEHLAAVWEHPRQSGSSLLVLLAVANYSDHRGEWFVDQATLQKRTGLSRRRVQQILAELVAAGELAVVPGDGRGHLSTYRLIGSTERAQPTAPFPEKGEAGCALPEKKGEAGCTLSAEKGAEECTLPAGKGEVECALSDPLAPPCPPGPPFPPDPLIPLYPPIPLPPPEKQNQETFGLRPLSGPQSAVFRVNLLLEEAGVPLPSPAQIGLWSKALGGIEPLLDLLGRLVQAGLANKREPIVYAHRVVMERAERPARPGGPGRAGTGSTRAVGVDARRRQQAAALARGGRAS